MLLLKFAFIYFPKYRFQLETTLKHHKNNVHEEKKLKVTCEICGKQFIHNAALSKHMHRHEDPSEKLARSTQCKYCGEWLATTGGLYYHKQIHTSGPQTCQKCGVELPNKIALSAHIRKAHREPRFKCSYCDSLFSERTKLTVVNMFIKHYFVEMLNNHYSYYFSFRFCAIVSGA